MRLTRTDLIFGLAALVLGGLGMGLYRVGEHAWQDHLLLDFIRHQMIQQQQQQAPKPSTLGEDGQRRPRERASDRLLIADTNERNENRDGLGCSQ
jgi:hypothetical protein